MLYFLLIFFSVIFTTLISIDIYCLVRIKSHLIEIENAIDEVTGLYYELIEANVPEEKEDGV